MTTATRDVAPKRRKDDPARKRKEGARVDIRTTSEIRRLIEQAATLQGLTVSEYAKAILVDHAQAVIERHETRSLSERDRDLFLSLLDGPPAPNDALLAAAADFRRAVESGTLIP
jgi:uncharacterized protein (DUF1778 family)